MTASRSRCSACGCTCCRPAAGSISRSATRPSGRRMTSTDRLCRTRGAAVRLTDLRHVCGPNVFTTSPVTVARLELDDLTGKETTDFGNFGDRLTAVLPGLASHHCAAGRPGGFLDALARGTYFGHVTEHVALELSGLAGRAVHLGRTMWAGADGCYDVMMQCPQDEPADSAVPADLLRLAMQIVQDVLGGASPECADSIEAIATLAERERLGISTAAIAAAARSRGIPARRVGSGSLL